MKRLNAIYEFLYNLNLETESIDAYLHILKKKKSTLSSIRKALDLGRDKAERIVNDLIEQELITEKEDISGKFIQAESLDKLQRLSNRNKEKTNKKQKDLAAIADELKEITKKSKYTSKVIHYKGIDGLKKIMWNSAKAKDTLRLFEVQDMSEFLDFGFYEEIRKVYTANKIHSYELTNGKHMPGWTNVSKYVECCWEVRHIDPSVVKMKFEMLIYNDVYTLYRGNEYGIFGVEIYNEKLARFQKQLFDFMWKKGKEMKVLNEHGECEIEFQRDPVK